MAFKLPFTLPTLDRRNRSPQTPGVVPLVERRSNRGNRLPLIGHLEIQTQFRILGTVFLISLLIAIASVFIQAQATARGTAYLSVANHIPTLTQQIPRAAVNATLGQKEGFTELREGRDQFARTLETLAEGGEVKGVKVAATSTEARPALDALREGWTRQSDAIFAPAGAGKPAGCNQQAGHRFGKAKQSHHRSGGSGRRQVPRY
jgi:hypothetical protein